jgi:hypothetical protein
MKLTGEKLRAVINMLADEKQAHAAAHILTEAAKETKDLLADFISNNLGTKNTKVKDIPKRPPHPPVHTNVDEDGMAFDDEEGFYCTVEILHRTERAILVSNNEQQVWLPKSQSHVINHYFADCFVIWITCWIAKQKDILDWRD